MRGKKQEAEVSGQPQPQIIYVKETKRGCLGGLFKFVGAAFVLMIGIVVVGTLMSGDESKGVNPPARDASGAVVQSEQEDAEIGSGDNPAPIATTITRDGLEITVNSVTESDTAGVLTSYEAGWSYLILDVTIKNVSDGKKSVNPLYWSAKDIDLGYTYDDELFGSGNGPQLSAGDLSPNDLVRGEVVIKVQTEGSRIRIKYDTSPIGGANLYWLYER